MPRLRVASRVAPNNTYGKHPVLRCLLDGPGGVVPDVVPAAGLEELIVLLPGLATLGESEASLEVTVPSLIEHICVALQNLSGAELDRVGSSQLEPYPTSLIIPFETEAVCIRAIRWAESALAWLSGHSNQDLQAGLDAFLHYAGLKSLPAQDRMLLSSARERGVPVSGIAGRTFTLGQGCHQQRISGTKTSLTNVVSNQLAANKDYARRILDGLGIPVPQYARVYSPRAAVAAAEEFGYPVVMKPLFGSMGRGVVVGVSNAREVRRAFRQAREFSQSVLVEELVPGEDFRLLVINGKMVAAARRLPAHVVGDGKKTVRELVGEINSHPLRGKDHNAPLTELVLDDEAERLLGASGYDVDSVPAIEQIVFLRRNANLSTGGTAIDVTDQVHPETQRVAERTARAIGLDIAGVDVITTDISRSIFETGGKVGEVNSRPGIRKHIWPAEGRSRDVTGPIVNMLFPDGSNGRIPTIAVSGDVTADLVAQMLAHVLLGEGYRVGLGRDGRTFTCGIENPIRDRLTAPRLVSSVLLDPDVDIAVLHLDPGEIFEFGLGTDAIHISIVADRPSEESSRQHGDVAARRSWGLELQLRLTTDLVLTSDDAASFNAHAVDAEVVEMPTTVPRSRQATGFVISALSRLGIARRVSERALQGFTPTNQDQTSTPGPMPAAEEESR